MSPPPATEHAPPPRTGAEPPRVTGYAPPTATPPPPSTNATGFPQFPWPPPSGCTQVELPDEYLRKGTNLTLRDVDATLSHALNCAGYSEKSYYAIPAGFALVTRLEQTDAEGRPKPEPGRWAPNVDRTGRFSLASYLKALFTCPQGSFRVLVFAVTSTNFSATGEAPSRNQAETWLVGGWNGLPEPTASAAYTWTHRCTALVYEFETGTAPGAVLREPPRLPAKTHLEKAQLWPCFPRP